MHSVCRCVDSSLIFLLLLLRAKGDTSLRTAPPLVLHIIHHGLDELDDFFGILFVAPAATIQEPGRKWS
jgi:hypothetical protein